MGAGILSKQGAGTDRHLECLRMRWTVVVPGALLPSAIAADVLAGASVPWLTQALARAEVPPAAAVETRRAAHLAWLWRQFGGAGAPVTAPYALRALDADADCAAQCWHVDPVHLEIARDRLLVRTPDDTPPAADAEAVLTLHLREALDELCADASPTLHVHAGRWLLTLARQWSLQATPLDGAIGESAFEHWPEGTDAGTWRRLLTDVQMRWHQEQLDVGRDAQDHRPINAVWLHGGGPWRPLPQQPYQAVVSDDPVLRGWAVASGLSIDALHGEEQAVAARGDAVTIRRELLAAAQVEAWGQWLDRLQRLEGSLHRLHDASFAAGYAELDLVLCGRRQVSVARLRRGDAWRFWRRQPMALLLAEAG